MQLQIANIEPALEEQKEGKVVKEFLNVHFVTSLTPEEFFKLKEQTSEWGIQVEVKNKKK